MRIAVVTSLFPSPLRPREGIFAEERWRRMRARGHEVAIVHPRPRTPPLARGEWRAIAASPDREERAGLLVQRPRYWHWPGQSLGNAARFARAALSRLSPGTEVVVCDYAWPAARLAPVCGLPCVVNGRGSDVLEVAGEAGLAAPLAEGLGAAAGLCAVSADLVRAMDALDGGRGRTRLVPNGVDAELFHPRERVPLRAALGLGDEPLVLVVGHLIPRKDPLLALRAFRAGAPAGARLWFVGAGPLRGELEAAIAAAGLGERARIWGEVDPPRLAELYAAADLLLLTSRREGRPNVVLEAFASGLPVLATPAGGTGELVDDPRMLARDREAAELGRKLGALLATPPAPDELVARVAPLTWSASLDALEGVLADAVASAPAGAAP